MNKTPTAKSFLVAAPTVFLGWLLLHANPVVFDALSLHQASGLAGQIAVHCVLQSFPLLKILKQKTRYFFRGSG
jgi:hypothetical protein